MTSDQWIAKLASEIDTLAPEIQQLILQDAREAISELDEGDVVAVLGDPGTYANSAKAAFSFEPDLDNPQTRIGPVTIDFRGLPSSTVRSRIWNPANPHIITSKVFGIGWDINLGAIAVKLGLIRPDDYDEETIQAIPPTVHHVSTAYPAALTALTIIRTLLPHERSKAASIGNMPFGGNPDNLEPTRNSTYGRCAGSQRIGKRSSHTRIRRINERPKEERSGVGIGCHRGLPATTATGTCRPQAAVATTGENEWLISQHRC